MAELRALELALTEIVAQGGADAPRRICEASVAALPVDRAAITMMAGAAYQEPIWASDDVARELDELQFSLGEGPCVEAFTERRPVLVADLAELEERADERWPVFAAAARRTPVRALFVLPLQAGTITVGVLDLYRDTPGALEPDELTGALRTADAAMWTLLGLRDGVTESGGVEGAGRADPHGWLSGSQLHRTEVYQATGMVLAQMEVTPEVALSALRAYAFAHDRTIVEVAREVVARRLRFEEEKR
jgi:hypothetical protein